MSFEDDGDFFLVGSLFAKGLPAFILAACAVVFYLMAMSADYQCGKMECPPGQKPMTIKGECACVGKPAYRLPENPGEMR